MNDAPPGDERLRQGVDLFNAGEFYACHDVLEELWSELLTADRTFYQGMIHAAVALFHFEGGNLGGARKMYRSTLAYLGPYAPSHAGLDVESFLQAFEACFAELAALRDPRDTSVMLHAERVPRWRWLPVSGETTGSPAE